MPGIDSKLYYVYFNMAVYFQNKQNTYMDCHLNVYYFNMTITYLNNH